MVMNIAKADSLFSKYVLNCPSIKVPDNASEMQAMYSHRGFLNSLSALPEKNVIIRAPRDKNAIMPLPSKPNHAPNNPK